MTEEQEQLTPARAFVTKINKKTSDEGAGEIAKPLTEMSELFMLVPRGKYDFSFLPESMRLHGKSFTYQIEYHNVGKVFQLMKDPDGADQVLFVI